MSATSENDPQHDDRLVSLRATFEDVVDRIRYGAEWHGVDLDEAAASAQRRLKDLIDADFGPKYDGSYIAPLETCTEAELQRWFGANEHRRNLLERVKTWIHLARAVRAKRLLIDGSFITRKDDPGDVDCAILLPEDFTAQLLSGNPEAIELLVALFTRQPKELLFAEVEEDWWGWVEFFGRTRESSGRRKGLIEVML